MKNRVKKSATTAWAPSMEIADETQRVRNVLNGATELLRPFAENKIPGAMMTDPGRKRYAALGLFDGVGVLIRLAQFGAAGSSNDEDGPAYVAAFRAEGEAICESLQGAALNYMVIFSLFLTIFSAMAATTDPYSEDQTGGGAWLGDRADAAQWFAGGADAGSEAASKAVSLRRGMYIAELVFVMLGLVQCCIGLYTANQAYLWSASGLPNALSKMEYFLADPYRRMSRLNDFFGHTILLLLLALPLAAMRTCAVKFFVLLAGFFIYMAFGLADFSQRRGAFQSLVIAQHREARLLFARLDGRACSASCSSATAPHLR